MLNVTERPEDTLKILEIATKVDELTQTSRGMKRIDRLQLAMSLTACHYNGCPLDLDGLLTADNFNLLHDAMGIHINVSRETGKLENCFRPRYAKAS